MQKPPIVGSTMKAYCDCAKGETTWIIVPKLYSSTGSRHSGGWEYYWTCMNCGKKRWLGAWYDNGEQIEMSRG